MEPGSEISRPRSLRSSQSCSEPGTDAINSRGMMSRPVRQDVVPLLISDSLFFQFTLNQYGLIAEIPRTRRWLVTDKGRSVLG